MSLAKEVTRVKLNVKKEEIMGRNKRCPKCQGRMTIAGEETFGDFFGCTRNPEYIEALKGKKIESFLCNNCGYIEFYKKMKE